MSSGESSLTSSAGFSLSSRTGRAIIAAAVLGSALAYMSDDMLNVALPTLSSELDGGITEMQWVVNGYFVTMLALMLTAGSIGDIRGHRRTFLEGLLVFTIGAVICASAPLIVLLVVGRAIQGIGAAFLLASGLALVNRSFSPTERGRAVGFYMGMTAVATAAGPVLGGLLVDLFSWRAIFLAVLVFPLAAAVVAFLAVPETPRARERHPDVRSASVVFATIAAFSFALIRGPSNWLRPEIIAAIGIAVGGVATLIALQRRSEDPMLPLHLFRIRTFSGGNTVTLISYMVSAGVFFFLVVHLQTTLGYQPAAAGLALMPLYIIMLVGSPIAGRLADRIGARIPVVIGLGLMAVGAVLLGGIHADSAYWNGILPGLVLFATGLGTAGAPLTSATLSAVGDTDQGVASGVNNMAGQLAGLLMIAILPAAAGLSGTTLTGPDFADGYATAMTICALLTVAAGAVAGLTIVTARNRPSPQ